MNSDNTYKPKPRVIKRREFEKAREIPQDMRAAIEQLERSLNATRVALEKLKMQARLDF